MSGISKPVRVTTDDQLSDLILGVDWEEAVLREMHLVSPAYGQKRDGRASTAIYGGLPDARILITAIASRYAALELLFVRVHQMRIGFICDFEPRARLVHTARLDHPDRVLWTFGGDFVDDVEAEQLYVRVLEEAAWGPELRYGWQQPEDWT